MTPAGSGPRRVAQLIETLGVGGAERLAVQIAAARHQAGDVSHLYVMGGPGPLSATIPDGVRVRYFEYERAGVSNPFAFLASGRRGFRMLTDALEADGVDLIQSHLPGANFWALLLQIAGRVSAVPTIHNNREFDYGDADHPLRARLRRMAYREMMRRCPAAVAVSQLVKDSMVEQLGLGGSLASTMAVVPNGVPVPGPISPAKRAEVRKRYGCTGDEPLVLAAGRHSEQKNFGTLVEAAAKLRDRGAACRIVIGGDGPLRTTHQQHAARLDLADSVVFPGNIPDLSDVMQAADVFVLSSLWEGLPLVLLEAMAAGCAVAATRIAGVVEVIEDGATGLMAEPGDAASLADTVADLIADPDRRAALGAAARAEVERVHSFDRVAADLDALYRRIPRR